MDYWVRFMNRFPTVEALAKATEDEVLLLWQGLGYYSRARNLHHAAKQIVQLGHFPNTHETISTLKGVGTYTAAAIASIAFNIPVAVVDGNVYRVLARFFGIDTPINSTEGKKQFAALAQSLLPQHEPARYNEAIMDFGALQCLPVKGETSKLNNKTGKANKCNHVSDLAPAFCNSCPLNSQCVAFAQGLVRSLPVKTKLVTPKQRHMGYLYIRCGGEVAIRKRPAGDIWQGLWEPLLFQDEVIEDKIDWVAFKNQFFSAVMIAKTDFGTNNMLTSIPQEKGTGYLKQYKARLKTTFDPTGAQPTQLDFYYGPNDFRLLQQMESQSNFGKDLELERLVYLGWPLFRVINRWFTIYVFDWLTGFGFNMGVVLILITLLLKGITFPLVKKSYLSSAKMRVLKPKLEEATKEFNKPEDQMKKQQAMMSEYAKYGVSPLSGCLPMLIQMPIWIAMFNFVPNAIQLRGQSFLWIKDLSTYDPIYEWGHNVWLIGDHLSLTCILFCLSNVLYSVMTMRQQRDQMVGQQAEQMKMMQWMMYFMPVMFFFMFNDYSSGLNFYYFVSLFFSAAIMWFLRKTTNDEKLLRILEANYKEAESNPEKLRGLSARIQAMQQQQQELQRKREQLGKK